MHTPTRRHSSEPADERRGRESLRNAVAAGRWRCRMSTHSQHNTGGQRQSGTNIGEAKEREARESGGVSSRAQSRHPLNGLETGEHMSVCRTVVPCGTPVPEHRQEQKDSRRLAARLGTTRDVIAISRTALEQIRTNAEICRVVLVAEGGGGWGWSSANRPTQR